MNNKITKFAMANSEFRCGNYHEALRTYYYLIETKHLSPWFNKTLQISSRIAEKYLYGINEGDTLSLEHLINVVNINSVKNINLSKSPLVTVVITTYNDKVHLLESVNSLLHQSYSNIEIIIVDDNSDDGTEQMMLAYSKKHSNVFYYKLLCNLGTYFAKNYGIYHSKGEYLFFQDSDDISHPDRILLCMDKFLHHDVKVVNCEYSRFNDNKEIVRVNGQISRLGRITFGIHRSVIDDIGYFNCTTIASDDEFYRRIIKYYQTNFIQGVYHPLYYALSRDASLSSDMLGASEAHGIVQKNSPDRQLYMSEFEKIHMQIPKEQYAEYFRFPVTKDLVSVPNRLSKLANPDLPVVIGIFALEIDINISVLIETIQLLKKQSDELILFLDSNVEHNVNYKIDHCGVVIVYINANLQEQEVYRYIKNYYSMRESSYYWISFRFGRDSPLDYINFQLKNIIEIGSNNISSLDTLTCRSEEIYSIMSTNMI